MNETVEQYNAPQPSHLFLSNVPPSDSELTKLHALLHDVNAKLVVATSHSSVMEDELLHYHVNHLKSLHTSLKSAIFPIRRLPNEIIHKIIFLTCLPVPDSPTTSKAGGTRVWNSVDPNREPWTLARVSKGWRQSALGDHRLWSSLVFGVGAAGVNGSEKALTECLARSGEAPLAIRCSDEHKSFLLPHLLPSSERWELFEFDLNPDDVRTLKQAKGRLPNLHTLSLRPNTKQFDAILEVMGNTHFDCFEVAPKLRDATVHFFAQNFNHLSFGDLTAPETPWIDYYTNFTLPWYQLTSLVTDFPDVLKRCSQLIECKLYIFNFFAKGNNNIITLPNLRKLTVDASESTLVGLDNLVLPALETLSLSRHASHLPIRSLIDRSGCALKRLEINKFSFGDGIWVANLMGGCPDLRTVAVCNIPERRGVLDDNIPSIPGWCLDAEHFRYGLVTYRRFGGGDGFI